MKLIKTKAEIVEHRDVQGLLACVIKHEIKSSSGTLSYCGPRIKPELWQAVLSYLKWTYDTTKSEAQLRLYLNLKLGIWQAWPQPQEAGRGMTSQELKLTDAELAEDSRKRFASWGVEPSGDWLLFGTVHHHCSMSAFQSGTDEANEKGQDGLHLTVGSMADKHHDLHARFYRGGLCFEPELQEFWDIGEPWGGAPEPWVNKDAIARWQMGSPDGSPFPEAWKASLIVPVAVEKPAYCDHRPDLADKWDEMYGHLVGLKNRGLENMTEQQRCDQAAEEITSDLNAMQLSREDLEEAGETLEEPIVSLIVESCLKWRVKPEDVLREIEWQTNLEESNEKMLSDYGTDGGSLVQ